MDKSAIFVDAGYLLARGGLIVCGTKRRAELECAYEPLIEALIVVGVRGKSSPSTSQSRDLIREADEHLTIDRDLLEDFFASPEDVGDSGEVSRDAVLRIGRSLGDEWTAAATRSEMQAVLEQETIHREIDAQPLRDASKALGTRRIPDEFVRDLRMAFKSSVEGAIAEPVAGEASLAQ
jgi:hypothetical protein